ncbi:MAG: TetR/AcrR family transcriptional regulator [Prevotella sp.]|nr:TetR/AcrR family transcriptional regulator [Prevotella sp.]MDD7462615.1 TetR/AcrR family transcriptional regulator [Prevotellaceae bacterium]MDY3365883.1 TetR/AcrR family transcriptional regulator [Prevotella sp.]MDY3852552.1 TetR/AcrR family transcriptional regulator [Prevotella sp.]
MTEQRVELRQLILETAMSEFKAKGIKRVRMDDIAHQLGISKRTLYEVFSNKEQLLLEGVKDDEARKDEYMNAFIADGNHSVMDVLIEYYRFRLKWISTLNPLFFNELRRYDVVMDYLTELREKRECLTKTFIQRGIEEGYFADYFDYSIILKVMNMAIDGLLQKKMYKEYDFPSLFRNVNPFFLRGFCTLKGIEVIDRLILNETF